MSFQTRTIVALALCAVIFFVFNMLAPPPEPTEEVVDGKAVAGESEGKAEGKAEPAPVEAAPEPAPSETPSVPAVDHVVKNDLVAVHLTNRSPGRGGLVSGLELLSPHFQGHLTATDSLGLGSSRTLEVSFADEASDLRIPRDAAFEVELADERNFVVRYVADGVDVREHFELLEGFEARLTVTVVNRGKPPQNHRVHLGARVGAGTSQYEIPRGLCRTSEDLEEEALAGGFLSCGSGKEYGPIRYPGPILWGGVDRRYYATLMVPQAPAQDCEIRRDEETDAILTRLSSAVIELGSGESQDHVFGLYLGPKESEALRSFSAVSVGAEAGLEDAIDWGWFGGLSEALGKLLLGMLRWFYGITHSWGASIVLLTVVVKAVTLPLTLKQMDSMRRMREIQPEMAKIKEKYANDRTKQGQEMQALFARTGVNPLAGCLPTLVQIPIWFALYSMLSAAVELVHQPFLWLPDLTQQDPYYILPLGLGAMMVLQNRMMPNTMDEAQARMMRWMMPIMFTLFMLFLPSGLAVYIFANIVLSLIQTALTVGRAKPKPATT